jgi:hypothetical protein
MGRPIRERQTDFDFFSSQTFDPNQIDSGLSFLHSVRIATAPMDGVCVSRH